MKKKNKNKSLVSQTIHMFVIQSALLGIVIVTYICVSYYTVLENMQTSSRNLLQLYGKELENKLENADMLLERLIYKNNDYDMLQSEKESERYYASIEIKKFIQEQITYDQYVDAVVIGDSTYGSCMILTVTEPAGIRARTAGFTTTVRLLRGRARIIYLMQ